MLGAGKVTAVHRRGFGEADLSKDDIEYTQNFAVFYAPHLLNPATRAEILPRALRRVDADYKISVFSLGMHTFEKEIPVFVKILQQCVVQTGFEVPNDSATTVWSVGCGLASEVSACTAALGPIQYTGIDLRKESLFVADKIADKARQKGHNVTFVNHDAASLHFIPESAHGADLILSRHQESGGSLGPGPWVEMLVSAAQHLKPHGRLMVTSYTTEEADTLIEALNASKEWKALGLVPIVNTWDPTGKAVPAHSQIQPVGRPPRLDRLHWKTDGHVLVFAHRAEARALYEATSGH